MKQNVVPTNTELFFRDEDVIVSKTDLRGRITYANQEFCRLAGFSEAELLGQPHSIVRHPDMPRAVFKLLWDKLTAGSEVFAYVKNMSRNGDFYWVLAHVTPSYDMSRNIVGFHSNRRVPRRDVVSNTIAPLYAEVLAQEKREQNGQRALAAGYDFLTKFVEQKNTTYDALIFSL